MATTSPTYSGGTQTGGLETAVPFPQGLGLGSVEGKQKGSERMSLGSNKLIGPHVVFAQQVTLNASSATTDLKINLLEAATNYVVSVTPVNFNATTSLQATTLTQTDLTITHQSSGAGIANVLIVHI